MRISNPTTPFIDVHGWYQAATERRELLAMDDRMLRDIGITRVDAERIADEHRPRVLTRRAASSPRIDRAVIDAHIARAHRLRNEAYRRAFAALWQWLRPQPKARIRKLAPVAR
jgi:uncharacterized protein YjiS (DUF1127 family)